MPHLRVVVTWPGFDPDKDRAAVPMRQAGLQLTMAPKLRDRSREEVVSIMAGAWGGVVSTDPFDRQVFAACPDLRIIARVGVGTDSIDLEAATESGVVVTTTPGANGAVVADHTLAMLLSVARRVAEHDRSVRAGRWDRAGALTPGVVHGSTVGLIGFGAIGQAVAQRLGGFDVTILAHDPYAATSDGPEFVGLDELLHRSDIVSLHTPLTDGTRNLIGARELALMRPDAFIVNTARGGLIDEQALVDAVRSGGIAGAGLDVFVDEPPVGSPLLELPQVVLSPHIGGLSRDSIAEMTLRAARSVVELAQGRMPGSAVNPEAATAWTRGTQPTTVAGRGA